MELVFEGKTFILPPIYLEAPTEQKCKKKNVDVVIYIKRKKKILMACNLNTM